MELRKHPKMSWRDLGSWPPTWYGPHGPENPLPQGEVGVLAQVKSSDSELQPAHCILIMRYNDQDYFGSLILEDEEFLKSICIVLNAQIGKSIAEIGGLEIP